MGSTVTKGLFSRTLFWAPGYRGPVFSPRSDAMPIVEKLKEALKPGRKDPADDGELGRLLAASAKKVLLQKIEFEPASRGFSCQLQFLRSKYVLLNPRPEGAARPRGDEPPARRQGTDAWQRAGRGPCWVVTKWVGEALTD